jgi:hypothetical protein
MGKRTLLILACGLLLAQVGVIAASLQCQCCPCGTADNDCDHGCETCLCSSMARIAAPTQIGVRTLSPVGAIDPSSVLPQHSGIPQDIFHVPRLALT